MINIIDKYFCCGCGACVQKCPTKCITMQMDNEGFYYPKVDTNLCINCNSCNKVCPYIKKTSINEPNYAYAAKNTNENRRLKSSSGGIFTALAETILEKGGVVFGATFTDDLEVKHIYIEKADELDRLMGSKYVQSDINSTFITCESFLKANRDVLFTGTSCQIMALKYFLKKDYDKLFTIDIICHGVPSPGIWKEYITNEIKKLQINNKNITIRFRDKITGWKDYSFSIYKKLTAAPPLKTEIYNKNIFMKGFLSNIILRPSCFNCPAKHGKCKSDLTIGDFWGINQILPKFNDNMGVSIILVNTNQGKSILNETSNLELIKIKFEDSIFNNPYYKHAVVEPPIRKIFFKRYNQNKENKQYLIEDILKNTLHIPLYKRVFKRFILHLKHI